MDNSINIHDNVCSTSPKATCDSNVYDEIQGETSDSTVYEEMRGETLDPNVYEEMRGQTSDSNVFEEIQMNDFRNSKKIQSQIEAKASTSACSIDDLNAQKCQGQMGKKRFSHFSLY